jgi:hypothetical protein
VVDALDVVVTKELIVGVSLDVIVVRVDVAILILDPVAEEPYLSLYQEPQVEKVEMVESVEVMVSPELMEQQEQQEPQADVRLMVETEHKERLVVMEEIGECQVVILQIQEQVDPMEEQSQDPIIA